MPSSLRIERAKPLLGTIIRMRATASSEACAHDALAAGFAAIRTIHQLMSFHEADSEVSLLNRTAHLVFVPVHPHTFAVLGASLEIAAASDGVFDPTIAPVLVARGQLPMPDGACLADRTATWRDIELCDGAVRFHRPLWIDLGGIAKGYAADCACQAAMQSADAVLVNAGGDLRTSGPEIEHVRLADDLFAASDVPVVALNEASLASSCGVMPGAAVPSSEPHVCVRDATAQGERRFVSVIAPSCVHADALTKVVMAAPDHSDAILTQFGARAIVNDRASGWREIGSA